MFRADKIFMTTEAPKIIREPEVVDQRKLWGVEFTDGGRKGRVQIKNLRVYFSGEETRRGDYSLLFFAGDSLQSTYLGGQSDICPEKKWWQARCDGWMLEVSHTGELVVIPVKSEKPGIAMARLWQYQEGAIVEKALTAGEIRFADDQVVIPVPAKTGERGGVLVISSSEYERKSYPLVHSFLDGRKYFKDIK